jgi:hypothetical protein
VRLSPAAPARALDKTPLVDECPLVRAASDLAALVAGHNIELVFLIFESDKPRLGGDRGAPGGVAAVWITSIETVLVPALVAARVSLPK